MLVEEQRNNICWTLGNNDPDGGRNNNVPATTTLDPTRYILLNTCSLITLNSKPNFKGLWFAKQTITELMMVHRI